MTKASPLYEKIDIKKLEKSQVEITGQIPADEFAKYRAQALKHINEEVSIKGFRKGKVPEQTLISQVGIMPILEEMAELALSKAYPHIVIDNKIDAIGRPEIKITKMAEGNPLEFNIVTTVVPEVKLPDYKAISKKVSAKKDEPVTVTEKEVEEAITEVRKSRVDHSNHSHESLSKEDHDKLVEESMPELNNEFVQGLGDFTDVEDFKTKLRENIKSDKERKNLDKKRSELIEELVSGSTIDLPDILVQSELSRIESQFIYDLEQVGIPLDDYLKHIKKTIDGLRKEWTPQAEKKAKVQLILNTIAKEENIVPDQKRVEQEASFILAQHKDADLERVKVFVETMLTNEKVFEMLEGKESAAKETKDK
ncbi:MAG: trigger factor [Patescibacteria group bacterium]